MMWRLDPPRPESTSEARKIALWFYQCHVGIVHQGGLFTSTRRLSFDRRQFVLAFPKVKAHSTALEVHGILLSSQSHEFFHRLICILAFSFVLSVPDMIWSLVIPSQITHHGSCMAIKPAALRNHRDCPIVQTYDSWSKNLVRTKRYAKEL